MLELWAQFGGLQIEYNLIARTPERQLLPTAKEFGLTVTAWSPLGGGVLTGKYLDQSAQKDSEYAHFVNPEA